MDVWIYSRQGHNSENGTFLLLKIKPKANFGLVSSFLYLLLFIILSEWSGHINTWAFFGIHFFTGNKLGLCINHVQNFFITVERESNLLFFCSLKHWTVSQLYFIVCLCCGFRVVISFCWDVDVIYFVDFFFFFFFLRMPFFN